MSTNSTIGRLNPDGTVTKIYCHWDGYPEGNGEILLKNYTSDERVEELLQLGDLSSLGPIIEAPYGHSFVTPCPDVCIAYGRDRGEKNIDAKTLAEEEEFYNNGEEYNYLWKNGEWYVDRKKLEEILDPEEYQRKTRNKKLDRIVNS